jgi:hypothetical protein
VWSIVGASDVDEGLRIDGHAISVEAKSDYRDVMAGVIKGHHAAEIAALAPATSGIGDEVG